MKLFLHINAKKIETVISYFDNYLWFVGIQKAGYYFKKASSLEAVKKCKKPMMFIHGTKDDFVPYSMGLEVYKAAKCEKELYSVKGATHANSLYMNPNAY